jgi:high-affinity Fe2+/Pb2+ permease
MKPSAQANVLVFLGCGCMLSNILQKPLGLPDWTGFVLPIVGAGLVWLGVIVLRRAKASGQLQTAQPTQQQYRHRFWLAIVLVVLAGLTLPFYAPYTGITLPFPQLVICAIISSALSVVIVVLSMRRHRPTLQRTAGRSDV